MEGPFYRCFWTPEETLVVCWYTGGSGSVRPLSHREVDKYARNSNKIVALCNDLRGRALKRTARKGHAITMGFY